MTTKLTWIRDDGIGDFGGFRCKERDYQIERNSSRRFVLYGCKEGELLKPLCKGSLKVCQSFAQDLTELRDLAEKGSPHPGDGRQPFRPKVVWEGDEGWDAESEGKS